MKNLAGRACDAEVLAELAEAGILAVPSSRPQINREPITKWGGTLHGWTFERAWCYWTAKGPELPRDVALALHEARGSEVRTGGYAGGCPPYAFNEGTYPLPDAYHIDSAEGLRALADAIRAAFDPAAEIARLREIERVALAFVADTNPFLLDALREALTPKDR